MNIYTKVSLNIVVVFLIAIIMSFIPDSKCLHDIFFYQCVDFSTFEGSCSHNLHYHWVWQHYLWTGMNVCLFVVQVVRIIDIIDTKK